MKTKKKTLLLAALTLMAGFKGNAQTHSSISITPSGFNADVVANRTGHSIGKNTSSAGDNRIKGWNNLPNGIAKRNKANSTPNAKVHSCVALAGTYTIDKGSSASATNFPSFATAIQALIDCGVSSAVTFTIAPNSGPYNEQLTLTAINGASATNTITFNGNGNTISANPGPTDKGIITLDGADYIKFDNFNLTLATAATTGFGVQLKNQADNNTISNNTINLPLSISTTNAVNGIVAGFSPTSAGNNASNTSILNNTINGGYYGIAINGTTGNAGAVGNQIKGNQVKDSYSYGLHLNSVTNTLVDGNNISRPTLTAVASTFYGINLIGPSINNTIRKNRIHNTHDVALSLTGTVYGIYTSSPATAGSENIIANNAVYNINNNGGILMGMCNAGGNYASYYNNTVSADNPAISYSILRGMFFQSAANNLKFINNIISITSKATAKNAIYLGNSTITLVSNNNDFYIGTTGSIGFFSGDKVSLTDWKAANNNAYDLNSVSIDPLFVNVSTGNLQPFAVTLNNIGQALTTITDDITGGPRNTTSPDPGAYEFTPANNDVGISAILSPNTSCGLTNLETVSFTLNNFGSSPQSNIPVSYTINGGTAVNETFAGPLAPGASVTYTFATKANLSVPNSYIFEFSTGLAADEVIANNSITRTITAIPTVSNLPYNEDFENGNGGWLAGGVNATWAWGIPAKTYINSAGRGKKAWATNLTGQYNSSENSYVQSPCFNFTGIADPDFEMRVWWNSEFSADGAVLQSSIDGGATWQNVGAVGDPDNWYTDNSINGGPGTQLGASAQGWTGRFATNNGSSGWVNVKHKLTGLGGKANVKLRIAFGSDSFNQDDGFAFDYIRIGDNTNNLAVNSIVPISKLCGFSATEPITAVIENIGNVAATGFTVTYTVNGGTPVTETYTGSIAGGATANYTFTQGANLSAATNYTIVVTVNMTGDQEAANNSATYTTYNASFTGLPPVFDFEPVSGAGLAQLSKVTRSKSNITEDAGANFSGTKGMIMDGVDNTGWVQTSGVADPWTINTDNFSAVYICFNPGGGATDSLYLTFDLKQLFKTINTSTNFRVTVDGVPVGGPQGATIPNTYRPPFSGTPINWQKVKIDLTKFQNQSSMQIALESNVKEPYANGTGTANLIDNIEFKRVHVITGLKNDALQNQVYVSPNPSNGIFNVNLPTGKTYQLEVTDLTGKVIRHQQANGNAQLKLEGTAKGIYLLKVSGENGSVVRKLIVE